VGAAIVLRDDFDVLVAVASVELVLDAEVREVDVVIEVRQVVFAGPFFDFRRVAIRSPVAVGSAAIVLLEPRLILALELLIEDHPMDVRALLAQAFLLAEIGAIELSVMGQLARSVGPSAATRIARGPWAGLRSACLYSHLTQLAAPVVLLGRKSHDDGGGDARSDCPLFVRIPPRTGANRRQGTMRNGPDFIGVDWEEPMPLPTRNGLENHRTGTGSGGGNPLFPLHSFCRSRAGRSGSRRVATPFREMTAGLLGPVLLTFAPGAGRSFGFRFSRPELRPSAREP
jgi:hypothetical protein